MEPDCISDHKKRSHADDGESEATVFKRPKVDNSNGEEATSSEKPIPDIISHVPVAIKAIKTEPTGGDDEATSSGAVEDVAVQIKTEPTDDVQGANNADTTPVLPVLKKVKVEKAEAVSSTHRESCKYGIRCFRRNPMHRQEVAHYGDPDYTMPNYPTPPLGTPNCQYGSLCYRRHPQHFLAFSHPPNTDFAKNYRMRLRKRKAQQKDPNKTGDGGDNDSDLDEYDLDDPFIDDGDTEYEPDDDEEDSDDSDRPMKQPAIFFTNNQGADAKGTAQ